MHVNRRTLLALFFIICVKLSLAKDDEAAKRTPRKLINVSTSVKYVVPTRTSFTTVPLTCYSTLDVTGPCRRRRSFQERPAILAFDTGEPLDIDQILPTPKRKLEISSAPEELNQSIQTVESSKDVEDDERSSITKNQAGSLTGVSRWLLPPYPAFGLTYVDIQTTTITQTTLATVISGEKRFIVSGCVPSDFLYPTCAE